MFDRYDAWLLIGLFFWIGVCIIINALILRSRKVHRLEHRCKVLSRIAQNATVERDTVMARDEARRSHAAIARDAEIDRLNAVIAEKDDEIASLERKYDALVDLRAEICAKAGAKA